MKIGEILAKRSPVPQQREMSISEYNKLVDANAKLMDKIKVLEKKYNIMKENAETLAERVDKAIEYIKENCYYYDYKTYASLTGHEVIELLDILKGEDKE